MSLRITILLFFFLTQRIVAQSFEPQQGNLHDVNQQFHSAYNQLVSYEIKHLGDSLHPVMVFTGDTLIFKYRFQRQAARIIPATYHQLKTIDHLVLALYALVTPWLEGVLSKEQLLILQAHDSLCIKTLNGLNSDAFPDSILLRQKKIIQASQAYLRKLAKEKQYKIIDRNAFARALQKDLLANTDEAARLEIMNLHAQVQVWRKQLDTEAFHRLLVVIGSSHQARYREITVQYFDKILAEKSDGSALSEKRLVFAESVFTEAGCLSMLARHVIDQEIGTVFFGDRYRMQRDLLSDAAAKYLSLIFPEKSKK